MIIVEAIATAQSISVYVREHTGTSYSVVIVDESLNDTSTSTVSGTVTDGLLTINVTYNFIEGRYYSLKIYRSGALITFQKVYCTDQTDFDKYSVLEGYYTQPTKTATEYIVKPDLA